MSRTETLRKERQDKTSTGQLKYSDAIIGIQKCNVNFIRPQSEYTMYIFSSLTQTQNKLYYSTRDLRSTSCPMFGSSDNKIDGANKIGF